MEPENFEGSNVRLGPPRGATEDEVRTLCAQRTQWGGHDCVLSCWKPTRDELDEIERTGRVWLVVMGRNMPPVVLTGTDPR